MRVSTNTLYEFGTASMQQQQSALLKVQQQIASGRRILSPSDDPVAAAQALNVTQSKSMSEQFIVNGHTAAARLAETEGTLGAITKTLQDVRVLVVSAGNAGLSSSDRQSIANELQGRYDELLSLANSKGGDGNYLFSGYQSGIKPLTQTSGAAVFAGDQGVRMIQISQARSIAVSDSAEALFKPGSAQDPFAVIANVITELNSVPTSTTLNTSLASALTGLDGALTNVLSVRAGVGTRMKEVDSVTNAAQDTVLQYEQTLSQLQDVDYSKAISELSQRQVYLEAAQKSFMKVTGLSLFNLI